MLNKKIQFFQMNIIFYERVSNRIDSVIYKAKHDLVKGLDHETHS